MSAQSPSSTPAVIYAARSKAEEEGKDSTGDQVRLIRERLQHEPGRVVYGDPHVDHASGYKGNRGPGLEAAIRGAERAVAEQGGAELWVWITSRLGRGTGRPGEARAIGHLLYELRAKGITVRSVEDDEFATNEMLWGFASKMAAKYSEDLGANVARGLHGKALRGEWVGGIPSDGYRVLRTVETDGRTTARPDVDPDRRAIYDLLWALAVKGYSAEAIQVELDRRGYRTRPYKKGQRPRAFDANRVRQTLDNPFYAGLSVYKGEVVAEGKWPRYVSPEDFYRLKRERAKRGHVGKRRPAGRPPERYALARVARCGECGDAMDAVTVRTAKKDGTRSRRYVCRTHRERPQGCGAQPIDAEVVDGAVVENLHALLGDVDHLREQLSAGQQAERDRLEREVARAREDMALAEGAVGRMQTRYAAAEAAGDRDTADALLDALKAVRVERAQAQRRMDAALDALSAADEEPDDSEAAFAARLREELAGRLRHASGDVKRLNATLVDFMERVELTAEGHQVRIVPVLSDQAATRILRDVECWPHEVTAEVGDWPAVVVGSPEPGMVELALLIPRSHAHEVTEATPVSVTINGPNAVVAPNPHTPS